MAVLMLTLPRHIVFRLANVQINPSLTVTEEDGGQKLYEKLYTHFEWPGGQSGPTVGIGYDCGYCTPDEIRADWTGIISDDMIAVLVSASGMKGGVAQAWVSQYKTRVTISWDQANREFSEREVPKWLARMQAVLPNLDNLNAECNGALFSLSYNRGCAGYTNVNPRYMEMRAIRTHLSQMNFDRIPNEFRSMRRLWPVNGDLWKRRSHEATLFEVGLQEMKQKPLPLPTPAPTPAPVPAPQPHPVAPHGTGTVAAMVTGSASAVTHFVGLHWLIPAVLAGAALLCILFEVYLRKTTPQGSDK